MTILWPVSRLRPQNVAFELASRSLRGPASVSGFSQSVASDAGIWKVTFGNVIVKSRDEVLAWRAIDAHLEGMLNPILVPLCRAYQPIPSGMTSTRAAALLDKVPHSDDAFFDDDSGYVGLVVDVVVQNATVPARSISLTATIGQAGTIESGQHFSLGDRLYRIRTVNYFSPTSAQITFRPPLREAVKAGDRLEFDNPVCRMRLASDDAMDLDLAGRRFGNPTVSFIEDI